jgi:HAD superfamily hydrolase (TIGR01509 family)
MSCMESASYQRGPNGVRGGVILDVDGTLLDSNDAHAEAWAAAFEEQGYYLSPARIRPLIGKGGDKLVPELIGLSEDSPIGRRVSRRRGEIFRAKHLPGLRPFAGARSLVERLQREGWRVVAASSSSSSDLAGLLERSGVRDLLEGETSKDDAGRSKPDPDVVCAAMGELALPAARVVMIGDTPYDIEAASRAGVPTIALRCGGWSDFDLRGAAAIYDDPGDLLQHLDESPLAAERRRVA